MKKISLWITVVAFTCSLAGFVHAGGTNSLLVTAIVLSKSNCKFNSTPGPVNFGNLNPANSVDVTASTTVTFRCGGSAPNATYLITQDYGRYETGPSANRMRHTTVTTEFLPYTLALNPTSGTVAKNITTTVTVTGTVKASDYQNAYAGTYSDSVVISIAP